MYTSIILFCRKVHMYKTDLEIANNASKKHIKDIAASINIPEDALIVYGNDKAKINYDYLLNIKTRDKLQKNVEKIEKDLAHHDDLLLVGRFQIQNWMRLTLNLRPLA